MKKEHEDLLCKIIDKNKPASNRQFWTTEIISIVEQFLKETDTEVKNLAQPDVSGELQQDDDPFTLDDSWFEEEDKREVGL